MVTPPRRATPIGRQIRQHFAEGLISIVVAIAAMALIALVWRMESRSVESESNDVRARVQATVTGQSLVLAEQIRREMLGVQQSLLILREAFQADPDHFDIDAWRQRMPALTDIIVDAFIVDAQFVIRHDIHPAEVGLGIGASMTSMFGPETDKPPPWEHLFIAPIMQTRQYTALMLLRLDRPGGWLVGAAYRTGALTRLFAEADLGLQGMAALIDTRYRGVQAVVGPAAANPNYDIGASAMYAAMQLQPDASWVGASAPDGVRRIHGFRQVSGHQKAVVVAIAEAEAMRPARAWAQDVRMLALLATLVVLVATGVALYVVWTLRSKRRLQQSLQRERALVTNIQVELAEARARLGGRAWQFHALFDGVDEGALVLDAELHVVEWNQHFATLFGIAPAVLQPGLPFDELLRVQAREGAFGALDDNEGEVARRLTQLSGGSETFPAIYAGPGGRTLVVFSSRHADGSLLLMVREATERDLNHSVAEPEMPG